ncbi:MAG: hypothetical protein CVT64_11950 [Actinobacteria bacterium HGW-Actinobacteria-4]|nr:MAG: hypothetical protein CVT64_11950 [Actinobacteria bacterium HGW-Actinobacteria-4]
MTDQQLTQGDLESMDSEQIVQAKREGRLNVLLGMDTSGADVIRKAKAGMITAADVEQLNRLEEYDLIIAAAHQGRINYKKEHQS